MGEPSVSVIIPAYKAAGTIARALDSALGQTRPPQEILVVDDGSPDDIASAVAPYGPAVTLVRKTNGGAAGARNLGIDRARGNFIAFLDADDTWEPTKLQRQLELFQRHPELGLVATDNFLEEPGRPRVPRTTKFGAYANRVLRAQGIDAFDVGAKVWTTTVLVRREVLADHRFVSGLEPAEDRDLWVRLVLAAPVFLIPEPLATAVLEPGSLSRTRIDRDCSNMLEVVRRHAGLLGRGGVRQWEASTFRRWAGETLVNGDPRGAVPLAWKRVVRQPLSAEGWWVLLKSLVLALRPPAARAAAGAPAPQ